MLRKRSVLISVTLVGMLQMVAPSVAFPQDCPPEIQAWADSLYGGAVRCTVQRVIEIIIVPVIVVDSTAVSNAVVPMQPSRSLTWTDGQSLRFGMTSTAPVRPGEFLLLVDDGSRNWYLGETSLSDYSILTAETTELRWSMRPEYPARYEFGALRLR